jgi:hypothetical protein
MAFRRMTETQVFKLWHKAEVAKHLGHIKQIEEKVEELMHPSNLKIEEYSA